MGPQNCQPLLSISPALFLLKIKFLVLRYKFGDKSFSMEMRSSLPWSVERDMLIKYK